MLASKITEQISCMHPCLVCRETASQLISMSCPVLFILYAIQHLQYWSVLEHMATSLTSLFPTRQALSNLLNQGSNFSGSSPSYTGLNQTIYQIPFVVYFPLIALKPDPGATDFSRSYLNVLPCFDSHFVEIASHDSVILPNNAENFPCQWYSSLH